MSVTPVPQHHLHEIQLAELRLIMISVVTNHPHHLIVHIREEDGLGPTAIFDDHFKAAYSHWKRICNCCFCVMFVFR